MSRRSLALPSALALLFVAFSGAIACSKQGEGERCSTQSGDDDCESGLVCKQVSGANATVCCPSNPADATTDICKGGAVVEDAGADAGSDGDAATESGGGDTGTTTDGTTTDAASANPGYGRSCHYNSECVSFTDDAGVTTPEPFLACITGKCLYQCRADVDCAAGEVCNPPGVCGAPGADTGVVDTGSSVDSSSDSSSGDAADSSADTSSGDTSSSGG